MMPIELHYQVVSLDAVLNHYGRSFEARKGEIIVSCEVVAVDTANKKVVFKIYTEPVVEIQNAGGVK